MPYSGMLRRVRLVKIDVSEESIAFIIRVIRVFLCSVFRLLLTAKVVPSLLILVNLMMEAISFSEISVLTRVTRHNVPVDAIIKNE
jgi:hypothetical protein